jgi:hypothetical protein
MGHAGGVARHDRRWPNLRRVRRAAIIVVAVGQLAVPVAAGGDDIDGADLDPLEKTFTLAERRCGDPSTGERSCADLAAALGRQPGMRVRTFDQVTAALPSRLRSRCDVEPDDVGWPTIFVRCFDAADTDQSEWLTQGIAGTDEWRTGKTPGGGTHYLVATWCWRGSEGIDEADVCDEDERVRRTRISIIDVDRDAYRNVELVEPATQQPAGGAPVVASRGLLIHAGGAAIAGPWLYVADTDRLYVFNLDHFVQEGNGPHQLPVWASYEIADAGDRDKHNAFSSISVDGSGPSPRLVAAEYSFDSHADTLVTAWPLGTDGQLPPADPHIRSTRAYTIDGQSGIDRVQGVAAAGDIFLFAESSDTIERTPAGGPRRAADRCIEWGAGTGEDLYAARGPDLLVGINEGFLGTGSAFWAVSYRHAFGPEPPPHGSPKHDC